MAPARRVLVLLLCRRPARTARGMNKTVQQTDLADLTEQKSALDWVGFLLRAFNSLTA